MTLHMRFLGLVALLGLFVGLPGCGPRHVKVAGKLTKGGQALKISDQGLVQVIFHPEGSSEGGSTYPANVNNQTGEFDVPGPRGNGIPPGKYTISVEAHDPYPAGKDLLAGKFRPGSSQIVREVNGGEEVVIDLDKP
jgi:hypothetical protein